MKTYNAALIGCGNIGSEFDRTPHAKIARTHAGAYVMHPQTNLVAACDSNTKRLAEFQRRWKVKNVYTNYEEMVRKEGIDILSICTPPKTHWPIVQAVLCKPPRAIFCEKPIADNVKDAQEMVRTCRAKRTLLMVNHQRRFFPFWREVKEKIEGGWLGSIQQANCYYTRGIYNTGVHLLNLFTFLFGPAVWTMSVASKNKSTVKGDPNLDGTVRFKNGISLTMKACDDTHFLILEIDVIGSKGRLRVGPQVEYFPSRPAKNLLGKQELTGPTPPPLKTEFGPISLTYGVDHIIQCLERKERPLSSGAQSIHTLSIIEAMVQSAKISQPVDIV